MKNSDLLKRLGKIDGKIPPEDVRAAQRALAPLWPCDPLPTIEGIRPDALVIAARIFAFLDAVHAQDTELGEVSE